MRRLSSRLYFCPKVKEMVTLVDQCCGTCPDDGTAGVLSCSHQEECAKAQCTKDGIPVYPWQSCPACCPPGKEKEKG